MRILHVIARMNVGGTATYLFNLLKGLETSGVETLLAVGRVPINEREDGRIEQLNYRRIQKLSRAISPFSDVRARNQIWQVVEHYKPDVIHSHTFKAGLLVRSKSSSIPIIHTFHGHHLYDPDYGKISKLILNSIERELANKSRKIITIGAKVGYELVEVGIGREDQYLSIPPGVQTPKLENRTKLLKSYSISSGPLNILWMGRLTRVKRPDRVIDLAKHFPECNFIVAGDGELRTELESKASSNVHFLGVQSSDEMFSIADILLMTSDSEGMPLTLIEGQMAGIPAVATDVGSVSEIIENEVTGLITSTEINQIASGLAMLINNSMLRSAMGKKAKKRALELFTIDKMVRSHIMVYEQVLK